MKAQVNRLSKEAQRYIDTVTRKNIVEETKAYLEAIDIVWLYTICEQLGFRKERAERIYRAYWENREKLQEEFQGEEYDGTESIAAAQYLRQIGVNYSEIYENLGKPELDVQFSCHANGKEIKK